MLAKALRPLYDAIRGVFKGLFLFQSKRKCPHLSETTTTETYSTETISEAFHVASDLPIKQSTVLLDAYLRFYNKTGKDEVDAQNADLMNVFIRLGAYERFIAEYDDIPGYYKYYNRLVTAEDISLFKERMIPYSSLYSNTAKLTIPQKFLVALCQELGFGMPENKRSLEPVLNMFYDLYDEDQSIVDGEVLRQKCMRVIDQFNFDAFKITVEIYNYSESTYMTLFRPYFKRSNTVDQEDVLKFMRAYTAISRYRTIYSNHRNIGSYKNRAERFNVFISGYTEGSVEYSLHKKPDVIAPFIENNPEGVEVLSMLMESFTPDLNMYFAFLAYVDPLDYAKLFVTMESHVDKIPDLLHDLQEFSKRFNNDPSTFPRHGEEPTSMDSTTQTQLEVTPEPPAAPSAPKVEIVPGEDRLKSEPSFTRDVPPASEVTPAVAQAKDLISETEGTISLLEREFEHKQREMEQTKFRIEEQKALLSFYENYIKNNS